MAKADKIISKIIKFVMIILILIFIFFITTYYFMWSKTTLINKNLSYDDKMLIVSEYGINENYINCITQIDDSYQLYIDNIADPREFFEECVSIKSDESAGKKLEDINISNHCEFECIYNDINMDIEIYKRNENYSITIKTAHYDTPESIKRIAKNGEHELSLFR